MIDQGHRARNGQCRDQHMDDHRGPAVSGKHMGGYPGIDPEQAAQDQKIQQAADIIFPERPEILKGITVDRARLHQEIRQDVGRDRADDHPVDPQLICQRDRYGQVHGNTDQRPVPELLEDPADRPDLAQVLAQAQVLGLEPPSP